MYGAPGRNADPLDGLLLNYRDSKSLSLLITEIKQFISLTKIDGINLDLCDSMPLFYQVDKQELSRKDNDGTTFIYTERERLVGKAVINNRIYSLNDCKGMNNY
jgi:hypothetical protein